MEERKRLFTSEHVSPGHPDKVCDQISDHILDLHYAGAIEGCEPVEVHRERVMENVLATRVAVESLAKGNTVVLAGEVTSKTQLDYKKAVSEKLKQIGYTPDISPEFNYDNFDFIQIISKQSPDIDACVSRDEVGAGDQGIMFGYAVNEAPDYTGWCHYIARMIVSEIWKMKLANDSTGMKSICPDYKTQVTIDYGPEVPKLETILVSCSHTIETPVERLKEAIERKVRMTIEQYSGIESWNLDVSDYKVLVNPYGPFTIFGPVADSGLTGRKIVCDQYGGYAPVGGGAFSGKDLTKVDRTAAYMARFVAKNIMNGLVRGYVSSPFDDPYDCSVETAYIIGQAEPVSVTVTVRDKSGDTWVVPEEDLEKLFDIPIYKLFKPTESIRYLSLEQVRYSDVAAFGHIGVDTVGTFKPWEQII